MTATDTIEAVDTSTKVVMRPPKKFNVVLFNDDFTTVDFVITILIVIFHKSLEEAHDLTLQIHENGRGIAGTYSNEIAVEKRDETLATAKMNGFPLRCEIQEVD